MRTISEMPSLACVVVCGLFAIGCTDAPPKAAISGRTEPSPDTQNKIFDAPSNAELKFGKQVVLRPKAGELIGTVMDVALTDSLVLIADGVEANVKVFDWAGRHLATLGRAGDGPGEFREPVGISISPANEVLVLDRRRMRVSVWSLKTKGELRSWPHQMALASSIALSPDHQHVLLIGARRASNGATVVGEFDFKGRQLRSFGSPPPVSQPGQGSFRVYIGDRVGSRIAFTHSSTNVIWQLSDSSVATWELLKDSYRRWNWNEKPDQKGAGLTGWLGKQMWTNKLFSLDDKRFVVGIGRPLTSEKRFRYRYVLVDVDVGQVAVTPEVDAQLFVSFKNQLFGVNELSDGSAELNAYRLVK